MFSCKSKKKGITHLGVHHTSSTLFHIRYTLYASERFFKGVILLSYRGEEERKREGCYFFGARAIAMVPVRITSLMPMGRSKSITALILDSGPVISTA